jgi:hypothetical protein
VNIYLWQAGKDITVVAVFNIFNYLGATLSFYLGNIIALKHMRYNYIFSSLSFILAFGITAAMGAGVTQYALLIGILGGFGDGFFFFNLNTFQADELDKEEMDQFMSIIGALNKASAIVTPIVSGIVIERFGFVVMVNILMVLLVAQLGLSFKMPDKQIDGLAKIDFKRTFERSAYGKVLWTNTVKAPYQQFTNMANSVFLFTLMTRESLIGVLNSSFAFISILMFVLYRFMLKKITRKRAMLYGAFSSSAVFLLLIKPSLVTFIIFGTMVSLGNAFFNTPMVGLQLHAAKVYSTNQAELLGNLMHRVIMLNAGRIVFFGLIYFFYEDFTSPIFAVFLVYNLLSPFLTYRLAREEI